MKIPDIKGLFSIARGMFDQRQARQAEELKQGQAKADTVELSSQGQTVQRMASERSDQGQRTQLVSDLKAQYEEGKLATDTAATAEAMVDYGLFDDIIQGK